MALRAFCVPPQPFGTCHSLSRRFPSKTNAPTLAAAALAVALDESREAAVRELMLDFERAAMAREDARSYLAQRLFAGSLQVPSKMLSINL